MLRWLDKYLSRLAAWRILRRNPRLRSALGFEETLWTRRIPDERTRALVATLRPERLSALEISGGRWADFGFASYRQTSFPEFDICRETLPERFDLIIAEHILEHVRFP